MKTLLNIATLLFLLAFSGGAFSMVFTCGRAAYEAAQHGEWSDALADTLFATLFLGCALALLAAIVS